MEHTYRKTATIKAERFDGSEKMIKEYDIIDGLRIGYGIYYSGIYRLPTKEGDMNISIGDWIATGVQGEHWAIGDSIFEATYERID